MARKPFTSSTREIPEVAGVPRHIAIIMDGNGRWARKRFMPRVAGHGRGVESVRAVIRACIAKGVSHLTLFAFSSENWRRPADEVSFLMQLFMRSLQKEIDRLHENGIRFRVIGDLSRFEPALVDMIRRAEALTADNDRLTLTIAANYGGRWDILQAVERMLAKHPERRTGFTEEDLNAELSLNYGPEPDLFIRTGGEQRISNFLLWQLAYSELYFTDTLWPDFDEKALDLAIASYQSRERRFGRTSEQLCESGKLPALPTANSDAADHA
ncbi:polyprenyl diphosphate synthase [Azoarcus sp. DN11]|uniref:polyprenyl diphosphate synthase n=1 Tax=Azoarcus sp. DN11 TaxID=356837 RepID=UPI000EAD4568|nr:polyprenyl diphosphate synthase [Azoarcus sp. DN11]AYH43148.1 di-trans,poly-cis-decaprenylcistransferase [Azoarcus sp. DN11]